MFIGGLNWDTTDGILFYITARDVAGPVVLKKPHLLYYQSHSVNTSRSLARSRPAPSCAMLLAVRGVLRS
jgi:hypothetical protein